MELGDRALIASAASALALGEAASGAIDAAREHLRRALEQVDRLTDEELAPRLEALYYLGWAENYLERYDDAIAHADRGLAIARAMGEGRLLVPMMLVKGYPFEMQGRLPEAKELCEAAVESTRLSGNPHYLFWALFELGFAHYHLGDLDAAIEACEESARVGGRMVGGTMPAGGRRAGLGARLRPFELGELDRGFEIIPASEGRRSRTRSPSSAATTGRSSPGGARPRRPEAAEAYVRRAEELSASSTCTCPRPLALRARAALMLHAGDAAGAAAEAKEAADEADGGRRPAAGGLRQRPRRAGRWRRRARGRRRWRCCGRPSASSTSCGSIACATRCAASCASSGARAEKHGARPPARTREWRRSPSASSRSPRWSPTARPTRRSRPSCSSAARRSSPTCATSS